MSNKEFEVISVLGPLGSGKTTTLNHLIERVPLGDSYAVVVNDVGENNIDAQRIWDHPANRSEKIIPLTAGCIGCSDVTQFREALERVHDAGVNVLFIEPTGIAPGTEIADVVQSSGFDLSVLTLVNARTIERDMKWQVLPSQLSVADIVGITHIPDAQGEAEVMAQVLDQLPPLADNIEVELIRPGDADYFGILARLRGMDKQLRFGRHILSGSIDHPHDHDSDGYSHDHHSRSHGISAKSFQLRPGTSADRVRDMLMPLVGDGQTPLLRAKGVVDSLRFDVVGDEWIVQQDASGLQTMNVIFGGHIPTTFLENARHISQSVERISMAGDKKSIVKSISEMPITDRVEIASERTGQYPSPISPMHGELIPDCEADEGYEIAFWGNKDDMPDGVKRLTMKEYIQFRLSGVHELIHHSEHISNITDKKAYWARRYGATLGYNGYYLKDYIDEEQYAEIRKLNPAAMLCAGFMELDSLTFDEGRAEEKPEFVANVLKAAIEGGDLAQDDAIRLKSHALELSKDSPSFSERWRGALSYID